ncbi:MAG: putative glutathione S-transferase [Rhodospirillales bacterium]|nr:putative glutathione S-transferase [Rhodospirillales bacterium]
MAAPIVYGIPGSPYLRSAMLALEEKSVAYELSALGFGQSKVEPYLSRQPFGRIPAFEHDGFALYETQAIIRYVDAVFPGDSLQPRDPRQAARMNQLIGIVDWYFFPRISATIAFQRVVRPHLGGTPDEAIIAAAVPPARHCISEIARLVGEAPYLAGDALSLADLMLAPQLVMVGMTPEGRDLIGEQPRLAAWLGRMKARPSMIKTAPPMPSA